MKEKTGKRIKVVVASNGTSAVPEFAGSTWVRLQYMLGLDHLGIECYWVDRLKPIDPLSHHHSLHYLTKRFARTARDFGFADRYCIVYNGGEQYFGITEEQLVEVATHADVLLNISGYLPEDSVLMRIPRRAYIDVDPGFTQIWGHQVDMGFERHNFFFTTGQNVGTEAFTIPTDGIKWLPIVPPVALDAWPLRFDERHTRISTVADWHAPQTAIFEGQNYGGKQAEFMRSLRVPEKSGRLFEIALGIDQAQHEDQAILLWHGWIIVDPYFYAGDPESYREFIQFSRAEFSVAKGGYVKSNSGWVSDRTACYLASGKPAVVQSTGFESTLPTGTGLLTFTTSDEAIAAITSVDANYREHCLAARELAERQFDSSVVLTRILEHVGLGDQLETAR
jgi:hypothetical protein